jgi:hypothetical protein
VEVVLVPAPRRPAVLCSIFSSCHQALLNDACVLCTVRTITYTKQAACLLLPDDVPVTANCGLILIMAGRGLLKSSVPTAATASNYDRAGQCCFLRAERWRDLNVSIAAALCCAVLRSLPSPFPGFGCV